MKKAQLKSIFLFAMIFLLSVASIWAWNVTLNYPDADWVTDISTNFNFTPSGGGVVDPFDWCGIYINQTSGSVLAANYSDVANGTPFVRGIGLSDSTGLSYTWNVSCSNGTSVVSATIDNYFGVDSTLPTITLDAPADEAYLSGVTDLLKYTPTDPSNADTCLLYTNISGAWIVNQTNTSYVSGIQIDMIAAGIDNKYMWNTNCNQSSGDIVWAGATNRTFTIDTVDPSVVNITYPVNNTYSDDSTPQIIWNLTTDLNFDKYVVNLSNSSDMAFVIQTIEITTITENTTTLANIETDGDYYISVSAIDLAGNAKSGNFVIQYNLDSDTGTIALNAPIDEKYLNNNDVDFNFTVTDDNPSNCTLLLSNSTALTSADVVYVNDTLTSTAGTVLNFSIPDMIDGGYKWNVECADSNNIKYNMSTTLLNVTVDTTAPTNTDLTSTFGGKNSTDGTPTITWNTTNENNFDKYVVEAYNSSNSVVIVQYNISTVGTSTYTMTVPFEHSLFFNVTVYDKAGNTNGALNTTAQSLTYIDSICANLSAGWNLCGLVRETSTNLSTIAAEMDATFISIWNETKQWQTCNYVTGAAGTNCDRLVGIGPTTNNATHVWVYVNSSTLWEDRIWGANKYSANLSLTNTTGNGWNIFGMFVRNGLTFEELNDTTRIARNASMYSLVYNNGTSHPYVTQDGFNSINNGVKVNYGRAYWVYANVTNYSVVNFNLGGW